MKCFIFQKRSNLFLLSNVRVMVYHTLLSFFLGGGAAPTAYGSSWAKDWIWATAATYICHSCDNAKSLIYYVTVETTLVIFFFFPFWPPLWHVEVPRPGIKPMPSQWPKLQQWQCQILNPLGHQGTPFINLFLITPNKLEVPLGQNQYNLRDH